jgi:hypothetical protein
MLADSRSQEQELSDITLSYQRLEKVVMMHLRDLQEVMNGSQNSPGPIPGNSGRDNAVF